MNSYSRTARSIDWMCQSPIEGMVALVVGGGSGVGESTARSFAANRGSVVVADLRAEEAARVAGDINAAGGYAHAVGLDISRQVDIDKAVAHTVDTFGRLDAVVNAAVLVKPASLEDCSLEDWTACFRVNVDGALMLARSCLPHLRRSPAPAIVNVASLSGITGYAGSGAYGPSKGALITLSRQMAIEWAGDGIRVNVVVPGSIETPLNVHVRPEVLAERANQIPLQRLGMAREVANLVVFLASPAASFITGQTITCDGGFSQNLFATPMGQVSAHRWI